MDMSIKSLRSQSFYSFASCMTLAIFAMLFLATDCKGQTSDNYETPGVLSAQNILPPTLLGGEGFKVHNEVITYGFTNYYNITTPYGLFEAEGDDMLRVRINELQAIAALKDIRKSTAFAKAAKQAAMSSVKGAWNLITHPVNTVTGVPKGVGRLFSRIGEMFKGKRGDAEDSETKELIGFSRIKRQYAYKLGVDVYSSNEVLQKELNSVSWAGFAGGMGIKLLTAPVSGAAGVIVKGTRLTYGMNKIMLDYAPEDLRRLNRKSLQQMEIEDSVIEEFLFHPKYSPRHKTFIVHALTEMEGVKNRDQFIKQALYAESELDAFIFQRIAEMMHGYHKNVGSIKEIIPVRRLVVGYTDKQTIVATLPLDYVYWTERAELGSAALVRLTSAGRPVKQVELWTTGAVTPRTMQELNSRGFIVKERIGGLLMPSSS